MRAAADLPRIGLRLAALLLALAAGSGGSAARGEETPTDFLRFVEGRKGEGKLETAIVVYRGTDGVEVFLIAAVHVADAAYYRELQRRFEKYDALLYEMIKESGAEPPGKRIRGGEKERDSLLSAFQRGLKDALGLEFQLDGVDYTRRNFVHADLDPETFFRLQRQKGESILGLLFKAALKGLERQADGRQPPGLIDILAALMSPDRKSSLKLLLARELEDMEMILSGFEEGTKDGSVIVVERNKVVIEALRKCLAQGKKRIGVFYGAGHMQDLEKRLTGELGLKKASVEWATAWDIRRKAPDAGKGGETRDPEESKKR